MLHKKWAPNSQITREAKIPKVYQHIGDLGQFLARFLSKRTMNPSIASGFSILSPTLTGHNFFENCPFQFFFMFWKATDLNRSFHPKTSSRDKIKVSLGTHAFGEFRKNHDLGPAPPHLRSSGRWFFQKIPIIRKFLVFSKNPYNSKISNFRFLKKWYFFSKI